MAAKPQIVEIDGKHLSLTNLDKVLYPLAGFTKGQVIDYYARIAPVLVPHLAGRPLTLKRYPEGVDKEYFFEKNATKHRPDWVKTAPVWSEHPPGRMGQDRADGAVGAGSIGSGTGAGFEWDLGAHAGIPRRRVCDRAEGIPLGWQAGARVAVYSAGAADLEVA